MDLDPYRVNPLVAEAASASGGSLLDRVIAFIGGSLKGRRVHRRQSARPD